MNKSCLYLGKVYGKSLISCMLMFFIMSCTTAVLHAQGNKIPSFSIQKTNGQLFRASDIPATKPVLLIYFSPECDHCQVFLKKWFSKAQDFANVSVVMITFLPVEKVKQFEKEYSTANYSNLIVGTEGLRFFVKNYYQLTDMPFAALYDKNHRQLSTHHKEIPLDKIAATLKKM